MLQLLTIGAQWREQCKYTNAAMPESWKRAGDMLIRRDQMSNRNAGGRIER